MPYPKYVDHDDLVVSGESVTSPVDKEDPIEHSRVHDEYQTIYQKIPSGSFVGYTDGSVLGNKSKGEETFCGSGFKIELEGRTLVKRAKALGENDINVGEVTAVHDLLKWLKENKYKRARRPREIHVFMDSETAKFMLTTEKNNEKYHRIVQETRRLMATMIEKFHLILHWVP